jgi:catechol 2,3-dioxygenase-like lactoylglutathione lyase family enzyme
MIMAIASTPTGSGTRPIPELSTLMPGGWNRIHLIVDDITAEVARVRMAGLSFRDSIIGGRVGQQILLHDPAGNLIELFDPVNR